MEEGGESSLARREGKSRSCGRPGARIGLGTCMSTRAGPGPGQD